MLAVWLCAQSAHSCTPEFVSRAIPRLQRVLQGAREGQVARRLSEAPRAPADRGGPARLPRLDHAGRGPRGRPHHRPLPPPKAAGGLDWRQPLRGGQEALHRATGDGRQQRGGGGGGGQRGHGRRRHRDGSSQRDWLRQRFRCCSNCKVDSLFQLQQVVARKKVSTLFDCSFNPEFP